MKNKFIYSLSYNFGTKKKKRVANVHQRKTSELNSYEKKKP